MRQSDRSTDVGLLLLVSAFMALNLPVVFTVFTGMDQYGLFMIESIARVWHLPLALSLSFNILLAFLAHRLYLWLRARDSHPPFQHWEAFYRHLVAISLPIAAAMLPGFLLGSNFGKPFYIVVGGLIILALSITAAFRDEEISISPEFAGQCFYAVIATILVLVILAIASLLVFFSMQQTPPTGSFFWEWRINWEGLGYTSEQFAERQKGAMLMFALSGIVYMSAVVGGAMTYAICARMRVDQTNDAPVEQAASQGQDDEDENSRADKQVTEARLASLPHWSAAVLKRLEWRGSEKWDYAAVFDGEEVGITEKQYHRLIVDKEKILSEADLFVNKAAADVYSKVEGRWERIRFRIRKGTTRGLSGPLSLLCICAQNPRHRFEAHELRHRLEAEMQGSGAINVSDFRNQLMTRQVRLNNDNFVPAVPLEYDGHGIFIGEEVKVCFIYDK